MNIEMRHLEFISSKSQELIENMNEIIWSLNNATDTIEGLIAHLRQYAFRFLEPTAIELSFFSRIKNKDTIISSMLRRHIVLLVKECFHNILKHANASKVVIYADFSDQLSLRIANNGRGFVMGEKMGNGLNNMKKRIEKMKGEFTIDGYCCLC